MRITSLLMKREVLILEKSELQKYIGATIKELRTKNNMTQGELGDRLGLKHNSISAIERGVNSCDANIIFAIAKIFNIKADDLFPPAELDMSPYIDMIKELKNETPNLDAKDMFFFKKLVEKTLSLGEQERAKFLENIQFVVNYYEKVYGDK